MRKRERKRKRERERKREEREGIEIAIDRARDGEFRELTDSRTTNSLVANINRGTVLKLHETQRINANLECSAVLIDRVVWVIKPYVQT